MCSGKNGCSNNTSCTCNCKEKKNNNQSSPQQHHADKAQPINRTMSPATPSTGSTIATISAADLLKKIHNKEAMTVVNVLSHDYYQECHIAGSISAPLDQLATRANTWDKNKLIVTYCANKDCNASKKGYELLIKQGFKNVVAYEGGIQEWQQKGYPVEGTACSKK